MLFRLLDIDRMDVNDFCDTNIYHIDAMLYTAGMHDAGCDSDVYACLNATPHRLGGTAESMSTRA